MSDNDTILGFAIWHPEHGFHQPYHYEGPLVYVRSDDSGIMTDCKEMNRESGQNNRKGWRIVPVSISRAPPASENSAQISDSEDITVRLTRGEPGPMPIEAAQEIRQLRNLLTAAREENERLRVKLEARNTRDPADFV